MLLRRRTRREGALGEKALPLINPVRQARVSCGGSESFILT
jgi:hypothetical protein